MSGCSREARSLLTVSSQLLLLSPACSPHGLLALQACSSSSNAARDAIHHNFTRSRSHLAAGPSSSSACQDQPTDRQHRHGRHQWPSTKETHFPHRSLSAAAFLHMPPHQAFWQLRWETQRCFWSSAAALSQPPLSAQPQPPPASALGGAMFPQAPSWGRTHEQLSACTGMQELLVALREATGAGAGASGGGELDAEALALALDKTAGWISSSRRASSSTAGPDPFFELVTDPRLSPSSEPSSRPDPHLTDTLLDLLGEQYMRLLPSLEPVGAVKLLHTFAILGHSPVPGSQGLLALSQHLREKVLPGLKAESIEHVASLLWAVGQLSAKESILLEEQSTGTRAVDSALFSLAASMLYTRIDTLQSRYLSKLAQAFASAGIYYYPLLLTVVNASKSKLSEFESASLTNLMKCLSKLHYTDDILFGQVAERMRLQMRRLDSHHVVTLVKAFASLKYNNEPFYEAASQKLQLNMSELRANQVSHVAWSYAVRGVQDIRLYNALAFRAGHILGKFKPMDLSTLIWSFAKQGLSQPRLMELSADVATRTLPSFNMRNMSNMMWGYARMDFYHKPLYDAVAERVKAMLEDPEGRLVERRADGVEVYHDAEGRIVERLPGRDEKGRVTERVTLGNGRGSVTRSVYAASSRLFIPQNLSDLAWAFADRKHSDPELFKLIALRAVTDMNLFGKTTVVDLAFSFATATQYDQELFCAIEDFALPFLPDFGPAYMSELLWSMATLRHKPGDSFLAAAMEVTWNKWERVTSDRGWLCKTIWALLTLEAEQVVPNHPLLAAFTDAMGASDMSLQGAPAPPAARGPGAGAGAAGEGTPLPA